MAKISLLIVQGLQPLLQIYLVKLLVDAITAKLNSVSSLQLLEDSKPLLIGLAIVLLVGLIANALSELVTTSQTQKVSDYMRSILHTKSIEIDLSYYENPRYHDTLQRAQQEATFRPNQILKRLALVGENGILLMAMVGLLLTLHWGITSTLLVAIIPTILVRLYYTRKLYEWQRTWTTADRKSAYLSWLLTGEQFAKEIRLFGLGELFSQWFDQLRSQLYQAKFKLMAWRSLSFLIANIIAGVMVGAIYGFILYQALQGVLKLGDLVLYHQALQRGQGALKSFIAGLSGLHEDNLFLTNLYEFLDLRPQIKTPLQPKFCPPVKEQGITFENVSFQYEGTTRQALEDLSFTIHPGETVALVGENGSGKTTLIKLLCRLYDPTQGRITLNGIDLRDLDVDHLRQQISIIFQDYAKYHLSAQDNIWLGNIHLPPQDKRIIEAAHDAGAHDVITQLPAGYDTMLGKLFHGGEELSIGQWQKVALARAFLRQSQVIVLDEPTSAMDPKAEYELFSKFRTLIKDQSAILITHRLSTVKMADRIYVMEKGRIVENGTHQELVEHRGTYAHLFEMQAKNYWS
ncbi:ABC transporter ATP-binding protein [Leptothoe sp. PORK10 BA2]|uniref:ABC transporter ATP-binding protein n=1 Tax=Leptothoe sp. PORK10 BA2 TaxID=3110254 RepID=UPI002B209435|nr:ABC transporter ATP-binding protein [Leptothoe sp. PORK10 BA2]MEA5466118.1 ABC transporter ATP-binding protein [Leptothoe sp. PORK10 BA2]